MYRHALATSVLLLCAHSAIASTADDIRILLYQGKAADAYALGIRSPDALGDPDFDFYFGIASIDAGHAGQGVLALERYALTYPDNQSARLQLARGYFALGEDARAREEFVALRQAGPGAEIEAAIDRYLDQIRLRETRYQTTAAFFLETGLGIDTNANAGVANSSVSLPNLGNIVIGPSGTKTRANFMLLDAGGFVSKPIAPGVSLVGSGQFEFKRVFDSKALSQGNYGVSGGVSVLRERNLYRIGLDSNLITTGSGNDKFRTYNGVSGEYQRQLDEMQSFSLGVQYGALRYTSVYQAKDAAATGITAGYRLLLPYAWQPLLSIGVNAGRERTLDRSRDDLSSHVIGARVGLGFTPAAKLGVALSYNLQRTDYQAADAFLGTARRDTYQVLDANLTYLYSRAVSLRLQANAARNRSNLALYEFPRETIALKIRYEFK